MEKIGIVILHYLNIKETIACISSFLKQDRTNVMIKIVVVDNGSNNGTGKLLQQKYRENTFVDILLLPNNLGFAKGNNAGLYFLQKKFIPDFVVYSNSDIIFTNESFFDWILDDYDKYHFSVLGPDVYSITNNFHQSPCYNLTYKDAKKMLHASLRNYFCIKLLYNCKLFLILKYIINMQNKRKKHSKILAPDYRKSSNQFTLHGSLLVFSSDFYKYFPEGLFDKTFLYVEENILKLYCDITHLNMVYDSNYSVNHVQAASTSLVCKDEYKHKLFRLKYIIESLKCYINLCKKYRYH